MSEESKSLPEAADKLLSLLPFNGDKTAIGAGLQILLPLLLVKLPVLSFAAPILDGLSLALLSFGLIHKGVKAISKK